MAATPALLSAAGIGSVPHGFALGDKDLDKILALLWMARDFASKIHINDIHHAALDVMFKHAAADQALASLHTASVAKLSELFLGFVASKVGGLYVEVVSFP